MMTQEQIFLRENQNNLHIFAIGDNITIARCSAGASAYGSGP